MKYSTRVIIESPYAGEVEKNRLFAILAMKDCFLRGEAPFVSHLLYPMALQKYSDEDRQRGILAGMAWTPVAEKSVVYTNLGISQGMIRGIARAESLGIEVERRELEIVL